MKRILLISLLALVSFAQAQKLPSEPVNGFAFPLGSKVVIKLVPTDSVNFDYSVLAIERYTETVDIRKVDALFSPNGQDSTIVLYFCIGTHGETAQEKDRNKQVLLIMKSYAKEGLNYTSEIQREEGGAFLKTSNVGLSPNVIGIETWPYMIRIIGLRTFKKVSPTATPTPTAVSAER